MEKMNTNRERAERALPLVSAYAAEHYWGTEHLDTVLADLISDILHLANLAEHCLDEVPANVRFLGGFDSNRPDTVLQSAQGCFEHERRFSPDEETD